MTRDTPTGLPVAVGDQAAYDALQDERFRGLRRFVYVAVGVIGVAAILADAVAFSVARRPVPSQSATPPAVHVACPAAPACPAIPPCAACPACPSPRSSHRDR